MERRAFLSGVGSVAGGIAIPTGFSSRSWVGLGSTVDKAGNSSFEFEAGDEGTDGFWIDQIIALDDGYALAGGIGQITRKETFDGTEVESYGQFVLVRSTEDGDVRWKRAVGGKLDNGDPEGDPTVLDAIQTADGGFALLGKIPTLSDGVEDGVRYYVVKTDENGEADWRSSVPDVNIDHEGPREATIIQTDDGGIVTAHGITSEFATTHPWIAKHGQDGQLAWQRRVEMGTPDYDGDLPKQKLHTAVPADRGCRLVFDPEFSEIQVVDIDGAGDIVSQESLPNMRTDSTPDTADTDMSISLLDIVSRPSGGYLSVGINQNERTGKIRSLDETFTEQFQTNFELSVDTPNMPDTLTASLAPDGGLLLFTKWGVGFSDPVRCFFRTNADGTLRWKYVEPRETRVYMQDVMDAFVTADGFGVVKHRSVPDRNYVHYDPELTVYEERDSAMLDGLLAVMAGGLAFAGICLPLQWVFNDE